MRFLDPGTGNRLVVTAVLALWLAATPVPSGAQTPAAVPVGVRVEISGDPTRRRADLEQLQRLGFSVIATPGSVEAPPFGVSWIDRVLAGDADSSALPIPSGAFGVVRVDRDTSAAAVRAGAWSHVAAGTAGVIFDDWRALLANDAALAEATAFAQTLARNAALYSPLRPVTPHPDRMIAIGGNRDAVTAHWLESSDALLLIAVNRTGTAHDVTFTFPAAIPEAVWQNMLTGTSVNFVVGPNGPTYRRTFPAHDVLVLMIRKRWR